MQKGSHVGLLWTAALACAGSVEAQTFPSSSSYSSSSVYFIAIFVVVAIILLSECARAHLVRGVPDSGYRVSPQHPIRQLLSASLPCSNLPLPIFSTPPPHGRCCCSRSASHPVCTASCQWATGANAGARLLPAQPSGSASEFG